MRYGANLNIIIKAIEKAVNKISRDFLEIENLQNNQEILRKFVNASYNKMKSILLEDLTKFRPDFNFKFSDSTEIINQKDAKYCFIIHPFDGVLNMTRAISDFTCAIALEHTDDGQKNTVAVAINKIIGNELYYCEKGFGVFLNNRKIRVSKNKDQFLIACEDASLITQDLLDKLKIKNFSLRNFGCKTLDIAYFASAKLDFVLLRNKNLDNIRPFFSLATESGGKIFEEEKFIYFTNS